MHDPATHDLFGNHVDGWYWKLTEECFEEQVEAFQGGRNWRAAAIAERLVATTDDVPAQLMAEYWDLWCDGWDGDLSHPIATERAMMAEIGRGAFIPADATAFIVEFICRMTETRAS